jgi:hypothetical protein
VGDRPPPFEPSPPLWRRRRARRDARSGAVTAPACAAPSRATLAEAGPASAGRARVAVGHARAVRVGRADTAGMGQAPLCIWAERGFGREALKLIFLFSDFIQIHANSKICVGFI